MAEGVVKELDVLDVRRPKKLKIKAKSKPKKRITYENTTVVLAIICSFMAIWIIHTVGLISWFNTAQMIIVLVVIPFFMTCGICYLCDKLVQEKTPADDGQSQSRGE